MADKVYTTTYSDFKGVDYTNDASNVWRKRSPTGVNMLPDESGRPFKRTGWEILLSKDKIKEMLTDAGVSFDDDILITKLAWFELKGVDHIVIFTDCGVIFYNGEVTAVNGEDDCYSGYDRCFFFEGGGTSAFYIYGNYRIWKYDDTFTLREATSEATIPTVIVSASADGTGTFLQGYNMFGSKAQIDYNDTNLKLNGSSYVGVLLPNNVAQGQLDDVSVWKRVSGKWDEMDVMASDEQMTAASQCKLISDAVVEGEKRAWIQFHTAPTQDVAGEDYVRVQFPNTEVTVTAYDGGTGHEPYFEIEGTASLVGGVS